MNKALIVVDMQHDFIDGALGFDKANTVIEPIVEKIREARKQGWSVIFTQDTHDEDYLHSEEGSHLPVEHCIEGTKGHKIHGLIEAERHSEDKVFKKPTFPSLELGNYLKKKTFDEIEVCGLVSNICVISNAIIAKAARPDARIVVDAKATASFDDSLNDQSLNVMEGLHIEIKNRS